MRNTSSASIRPRTNSRRRSFALLTKAIKAYEGRGPELRHGIALDNQITIILSQSDGSRPLCGIYFNLHSPYQRESLPKTVKPLPDEISDEQPKSEG